MTRQIFASALFAGLAAGTVAFLLQYLFINPLILEAEAYEAGIRAHFQASLDAPVQSPAGLDFETTRDLARDAQTFGFSLITYTAFALVLLAGMAFAERFGHAITARSGLIWGLAAFVTVQLAPAFGLPPEVPGAIGTALELRQIWWLGCVIATGIGLALIAFGAATIYPIIGITLMALPHLFGAPHLDTYFGIVPPELASRYVTAVLGTSA
ncbi:MAG: CbtA family protein, partial [Paracoccaceae bacterium]|nr:CbtA family protein [Paracoccaceae bacterium]